MGKRDDVLAILRRHGGELRLSLLKRRYREAYGAEIGVPEKATL